MGGSVFNATIGVIDAATAPISKLASIAKNPVVQGASLIGASFGVAESVNSFQDFESMMSQVKAISGATGQAFDDLTAKHRRWEATTKFTATESAEAFNYMAMAGWKPQQMIDGISGTERFGDNEDTGVGRFMECLVDVGYHQLLVFYETMHALSDHTQPFLDRLFEGAPDRHHLAHRFHARPQLTSHTMKLTQIPARDLADHIVENRFEESTCRLRHRVFQIKKAVTQSQLGCDESQRITSCFRASADERERRAFTSITR